jgi:hypothetical protein
MNNSVNPELRFRAAAELTNTHSHHCQTCGKHWGHHDPKGICLNRRDQYDRPSQMTCSGCLAKAPGSEVGVLLDEAEDVWGVA